MVLQRLGVSGPSPSVVPAPPAGPAALRCACDLSPPLAGLPSCMLGPGFILGAEMGTRKGKRGCGSRALPILAELRQAAALGAADTVQVLFALETGPVPDKGTCLLCGSM